MTCGFEEFTAQLEHGLLGLLARIRLPTQSLLNPCTGARDVTSEHFVLHSLGRGFRRITRRGAGQHALSSGFTSTEVVYGVTDAEVTGLPKSGVSA